MSYTLLSEKTRIAQKAHRCIWCGESIAAASPYIDERSVYDRELQRHKWHPECYDAMHEEAHNEGGELEFCPHENERPVQATANGEPS